MALRYQYSPAPLDGIGAALTKCFAALEANDNSFIRAAHSNVVIPVSSAAALDSIEEDIDTLSLVHPSRFFIVCIDEAQKTPSVSVSARCYALSKTEHVCSEIVRIACSKSTLTAVPSLIRANSLTDMATEIYLADALFSAELLKILMVPGSTLLLDSNDFEGRYEELEHVEHMTGTVLDLQWIGLGLWRDEIKDLFSRPLLKEYSRAIRSVEISASSGGAAAGSAALLLAGWIASRLGVGRNLSLDSDGVVCADGLGRTVRVVFRPTKSDGSSRLNEVRFKFDPLRGIPGAEAQYVRIGRSGEALETLVDLNVSYRTTRPFDDETTAGRIRRYFLIGESMTNYTAASKVALDFARLLSGKA